LRSTLLNGYVPTSGTTFYAISSGMSNTQSGFFRNVLGDVVQNGSNKQMLKTSSSGASTILTMASGADINYIGSAGSNWGQASSWSTGYIPTAVDRVVLGNKAVLHNDGIDAVDQLSLQNGGTLSVSAGSLTVAANTTMNGATTVSGGALALGGETAGSGSITLTGGNLNLAGTVRLNQLSVSAGNLTGAVGSTLSISESFQQTGGTLVLADAAFNEANGDMSVGNITANNLVLESENGALRQNAATSLHVKQQLITSTATGTTLGNSGNTIAAFAANNRLSGNITLVNALDTADTSTVVLNGISNTGGNVSIDNTGGVVTRAIGSDAEFLATIPSNVPSDAATKLGILGIDTIGGIRSAAGSVSLITHSPLTIGSGGVSASGNVNLLAGDAGSLLDNLVVNGLVTSTGGNVSLVSGYNLVLNAKATAPSGSVSLLAMRGSVIDNTNVASPATPPATRATPVKTPAAVSSQLDRTVNNIQAVPTVNTPAPTGGNPVSDNTQTTGGGSGNFGGDDDGGNGSSTGSGGATSAKPASKKLPVCT